MYLSTVLYRARHVHEAQHLPWLTPIDKQFSSKNSPLLRHERARIEPEKGDGIDEDVAVDAHQGLVDGERSSVDSDGDGIDPAKPQCEASGEGPDRLLVDNRGEQRDNRQSQRGEVEIPSWTSCPGQLRPVIVVIEDEDRGEGIDRRMRSDHGNNITRRLTPECVAELTQRVDQLRRKVWQIALRELEHELIIDISHRSFGVRPVVCGGLAPHSQRKFAKIGHEVGA
jgi:hypothetical protein